MGSTSIDRWQREIEDLKRMGANTVWYLPIQFGQRTPADFTKAKGHWKLQMEIGQAIAGAGLKVGVYQGLNDVFPETLMEHPEWKAKSGKYFLEEAHACPSIPAAWDAVQSLREHFFSDLPRIDYLITPATDYGGCSCDKCAPWPAMYLKRFEEQAAICRRFHPDSKIVAAGHGITLDDEDELRKLVSRAAWVDYLADIPRAAGRPIIKYYMSPEITMLGGWGKFGPCPILPTIERTYRKDVCGIGGHVPYSEGIHDDINKFACLRIAADRNSTARSVALEYARDWLGLTGAVADAVAGAILGMGQPVSIDRAYVDPENASLDPTPDDRLELLLRAQTNHPSVTQNHRYWLLVYRALYEAMSVASGRLDVDYLVQGLRACRSHLVRLEPEYGKFLSQLHPSFSPDKAEWVWPRGFHRAWHRELALQKGGIEP
jgi:hypothetical protein